MAEPPYKRTRRPDSKQMWDESDRRGPSNKNEDRRDGRTDGRNDGRRDEKGGDRNRRYRSRSPRGERDSRGGRDRERGGWDRRDPRDGGHDDRGGRRRDAEPSAAGRGGHRGKTDQAGLEFAYRPKPNNLQESGRDSRDTRERSRDRRRSRSPRHDKDERKERERERDRPRLSVEDAFTRDRTATPPLSFKSTHHGRPSSSHSAQDHDRMDTDEEAKPLKLKGAKPKKVEVPIEDDEEIIIEDDGMAAMQAMMGFGGFGTTQNKKVAGNDVSAVRKEKKTEYRQYMNRVGGFNRPLSPSRD